MSEPLSDEQLREIRTFKHIESYYSINVVDKLLAEIDRLKEEIERFEKLICDCQRKARALELTIAAMRRIVKGWEEAYPEDVFAPLPSPDTESNEMKTYRTCASAAMGRHMSKALINQFNMIDLEELTEAITEQEKGQ